MLVVKVNDRGDVLIAGTPDALMQLSGQISHVARDMYSLGFEQITTRSPYYRDLNKNGIKVTVAMGHTADMLRVVAGEEGCE